MPRAAAQVSRLTVNRVAATLDGNNENNHCQSKKAKHSKKVTSIMQKLDRAHTAATATIAASISVQSSVLLPLLPPAPSAPTSSTIKPDWFIAAVAMLEGEKGLGPTWGKLVKVWITFEGRDGAVYKGTRKLLTTHQPDVIKAWIGRAQSSTWRPVILDTSAYEAEFMLWWAALQPSWRKSGDGSLIFSKVVGDWEVLRRPGVNGMLSVLAGLFFWGVALRDSGIVCKGWNRAVSDCLVVLSSLIA